MSRKWAISLNKRSKNAADFWQGFIRAAATIDTDACHRYYTAKFAIQNSHFSIVLRCVNTKPLKESFD